MSAHLFEQAFRAPEHQAFLWEHAGGDTAALLVHGFPGTPADVRPVAEALYESGWSVQGILLPGFGSQIATLADRRCEEWVWAVRQSLIALRQRYPIVLLVGFSLGGALALRAAAVEPPAALVLLAPFWKLNHALWALLPVVRRIVPTIPIFRLISIDFSDPETRAGIASFMPEADLDDPQVREAIRSYRLPVRLIAEIRRAGIAGWRSAAAVDVPVMVIQGAQDDLVLPRLTRRLVQRFPAAPQYVELPAPHDLTDPTGLAWPGVRQSVLVFADIVRRTNVR
jgi:carboxylesterase